MLLEKGAVTDQIIDEFEAMVTEYFRNGNERRKTLKENTKPTNPMDYPTAPLPSDYGGNPCRPPSTLTRNASPTT